MSIIADIKFDNQSLLDSYGNLTSPNLDRLSAATDDNGVIKWGDRDQLINTSAQNDITTWWSPTYRVANSTANAIVCSTDNSVHYVAKGSLNSGGETLIFSFEAKAGVQDWISVNSKQASTNYITFWDLSSGVLGTVNAIHVANIESKGDGWYRCSIVLTPEVAVTWFIQPAEDDGDASFAGLDNPATPETHIRNIMLEELPSGNVIGSELITKQVNRDFSGASDWTNVDINAYDETGDLTVTANAADQYCTLAASEATMANTNWYLFQFDVANLASTWTISDFDAGFTIGTITANGSSQQFIFQYNDASTGGLRITSVDGSSSMDLDNLSLKQIPPLALLEPSDFVNSATISAQARYGTDGKLIAEGYGINLLPYSEDFSQWTNANTTDAEDIDGPNGGTSNATTLTATSANGTIKYTIPSTVSGAKETFSIWMKRITGTGAINMTEDDGSTWVEKTLTSDWQRFDVSGTETAPIVGVQIETDTDAIGIFGGQLEPTTYRTTYIPTIGSATVRTTEAYESGVSGFSWTMGSAVTDALANGTIAGTLVVEWEAIQDYDDVDTGQRGFVGVTDAVASLLSFNATEGGLTSEDGTNTQTLAAINWSKGDSLISIDRWSDALDKLHIINKLNLTLDLNAGNESALDANGFTVGTDLVLNHTNELGLRMKRLIIYNTYLTDEEIQNEIWEGSGSIQWGVSRWSDGQWNIERWGIQRWA